MDGPNTPVYTRYDGLIVKLSIPLENKRWNELNPTLKRRCELHYTPYKMRALHIRTGNKAVVINVVHDSVFRPKKVVLSRRNKYFPIEADTYDAATIKEFLRPYPVGSKPWYAQVEKLSGVKLHGAGISKVCAIYGGHWAFRKCNSQ